LRQNVRWLEEAGGFVLITPALRASCISRPEQESARMLGHNQKRLGAEVIADMLAGYGVTHVFMVPAVLRRTFAEMERRTSISRIHCHGEKSAAYMADGYARASGKPGICMAQVIGALNLAAGLRDAYLAHSPVIAITGGRDPKTKFRKVYQEIDDVPAFEPVTKFNVTVDDISRAPDMLRQAFRVATTGAPGPVHLQFRGNEGQLDAEEGELDGIVETQFAKVPPFRPQPEIQHVAAALDLLQKAERPIFVVGGGARASGARAEVVALAEALQIPIATSLNGKDIIASTHPLSVGVVGSYSRESANRAVNRADLVCFVGTETGGMTTHFWAVPKIGTRAIQIDIEPESIGRNYPLEASVLGDVKSVLAAMLAKADRASVGKRKAWIEEIGALRKEWYAKYDAILRSEQVPIHPARVCHALSQHVPDDAIVVVDTGHAGMWMGGMYDLRNPKQSYIRSAGHLGWAFPAGIGAKAACPDRPVVVFTGDAGFWYHIGELETQVRWNIPSVTLVNNNGGGNQSKRGFDRVYGGETDNRSRELWTYRQVNFAKIAEDIGALGIRVEKPNEIASALARAIESNRPAVIDVVTDIEMLAPTAVS
jgi:acetolactate synthase I/II/III large subunit